MTVSCNIFLHVVDVDPDIGSKYVCLDLPTNNQLTQSIMDEHILSLQTAKTHKTYMLFTVSTTHLYLKSCNTSFSEKKTSCYYTFTAQSPLLLWILHRSQKSIYCMCSYSVYLCLDHLHTFILQGIVNNFCCLHFYTSRIT